MDEIGDSTILKLHQKVPTLCCYFMNTIKPKDVLYTSLERYFNTFSARFCCIKIHSEMVEKLQV